MLFKKEQFNNLHQWLYVAKCYDMTCDLLTSSVNQSWKRMRSPPICCLGGRVGIDGPSPSPPPPPWAGSRRLPRVLMGLCPPSDNLRTASGHLRSSWDHLRKAVCIHRSYADLRLSQDNLKIFNKAVSVKITRPNSLQNFINTAKTIDLTRLCISAPSHICYHFYEEFIA